jgi:hypothetical protein
MYYVNKYHDVLKECDVVEIIKHCLETKRKTLSTLKYSFGTISQYYFFSIQIQT